MYSNWFFSQVSNRPGDRTERWASVRRREWKIAGSARLGVQQSELASPGNAH